jgi:hypothetical protein
VLYIVVTSTNEHTPPPAQAGPAQSWGAGPTGPMGRPVGEGLTGVLCDLLAAMALY